MSAPIGDSTRKRLIKCALKVLADEGVDAVTVRRIARDAGISHGAPLRHFPNRSALLSAIASTGYAELERRLRAVPPGEPRRRLTAACESYVDFARGGPALFELMFRSDMVPLGAAVFARFRQFVPGTDLVAASLWASLRGLALLPDADAVLAVTLAAYVR
ncbi:TetR/AcrR family transcriptional regulator [Kibdelosporangium persicum]|uniref:DNA-binding transcriptional regulator, AcrR family n=1 Tax=Kibdelosporangium persicum TaxID=2698649 RepID=A0ABX2F6W6_9PSEU|nr:TetR/AcrR family transcriptional regulator [Kibdelosporangium persicum]NRN66632.1 DNA-binding transcriptional regulator, AcrR family [Kibdelosporangium persicum]